MITELSEIANLSPIGKEHDGNKIYILASFLMSDMTISIPSNPRHARVITLNAI